MATISLGKVSFSWKGAYSSATTYNKQDVVSYNSSSYVCDTDGTTGVNPATITGTLVTTTTNHTVTVGVVGGDNKYFIDGVQQETLHLLKGGTYVFNVADSTMTGHPLAFSTTVDGTAYTTGVTSSGTAGNIGSTVTIVTDASTPATLFYKCGNHAGMGGRMNVKYTSTSIAYGSGWALMAQGVDNITENPGDIIYFNGTELTPLVAGSPGDVLKIDTNGFPYWGTSDTRSGMRVIGHQDPQGNVMYRKGNAIMDDGSIRYWGRGENHSAGRGSDTADRSYPTAVAFPFGSKRMTYVYSNYDYNSVSIDEDGGLWCWGGNGYGEGGTGSTGVLYTPYYASGDSANSINGKTVIQNAGAGGNRNYTSNHVLCSDGTVHACGYNGYGQIGNGNTTNQSRFVQVSGLTSITKIVKSDSQYSSLLALKSDGNVYAWGNNGAGVLASGNTTSSSTATLISYFYDNSITVTDIGLSCDTGAAGWAIDDADNLYTWGYNGYGNLGGSAGNRYAPELVLAGVSKAWMRNSDYSNTFAIKTDGSLWATGYNGYGQLGVGADSTSRSSFTECKADPNGNDVTAELESFNATGRSPIVDVQNAGAGSYGFTVALLADGSLHSVGYGGNGQLGQGNTDSTTYWFTPVLMHRKKAASFYLAGSGSEGAMFVKMTDGTFYAVGYGGESMIPDDDDEYATTLMPVAF
jgi:alpha-tubulin suppressor-like RCC1 family protein